MRGIQSQPVKIRRSAKLVTAGALLFVYASIGVLPGAGVARAQGFDILNPLKSIPKAMKDAFGAKGHHKGGSAGMDIGTGVAGLPDVSVVVNVPMPLGIPLTAQFVFRGPVDAIHVSSYRRHSARGFRTASAPLANTSLDKKSIEELKASEQAAREDAARNVDKSIGLFIGDLADWDAELRTLSRSNSKLSVKAATTGELTEVTEDEIRRLLDNAYKSHGLKIFEVDGEIWTKQRLQVLIVNKARAALRPFYNGVGAKGPGQEQLARVFDDAAGQIYQFAMETNELLGVSHSFDRLSRTIYEATDETNKNQAESAENLNNSEDIVEYFFNKALKSKAAALDGVAGKPAQTDTQPVTPDAMQAVLVDDLSFALRYRARRTTFDCINIVYPKLTEKAASGPTVEASLKSEKGLVPLAAVPHDGNDASQDAPQPAKNDMVLAIGEAPAIVGRNPNSIEKAVWRQLGQKCLPQIADLNLAGMKPLPVRAQVDGLSALLDGAAITAN